MVRFEGITEESTSERDKIHELKGLIRKVLRREVRIEDTGSSLHILTRDGNNIGAIYPYVHKMALKDSRFEEQAREIGIGYEKIYGLDGKKEEFVIETDYS